MHSWYDALLEDGAHLDGETLLHFGLLDKELALVYEPSFTVKCPRGDLSIIKVSGPDPLKFLQGQMTCDLRQVNDQHVCFGAFCSANGRIIALSHILPHAQNDYLLVMTRSTVALLLEKLHPAAQLSRISFEPMDDVYCAFSVAHDSHDESALSKAGQLKRNADDSYHFVLPGLGPTRIISIYRDEHILSAWESYQAEPIGMNAWRHLQIHALYPQINPETTGMFLPHDLNLPSLGAVSFDKGCYCGQEIIAKMQHHGKAPRHLQVFDHSQPCEPGDAIEIDGKSGKVLLASIKDDEHCWVLAVIKI